MNEVGIHGDTWKKLENWITDASKKQVKIGTPIKYIIQASSSIIVLKQEYDFKDMDKMIKYMGFPTKDNKLLLDLPDIKQYETASDVFLIQAKAVTPPILYLRDRGMNYVLSRGVNIPNEMITSPNKNGFRYAKDEIMKEVI